MARDTAGTTSVATRCRVSLTRAWESPGSHTQYAKCANSTSTRRPLAKAPAVSLALMWHRAHDRLLEQFVKDVREKSR